MCQELSFTVPFELEILSTALVEPHPQSPIWFDGGSRVYTYLIPVNRESLRQAYNQWRGRHGCIAESQAYGETSLAIST